MGESGSAKVLRPHLPGLSASPFKKYLSKVLPFLGPGKATLEILDIFNSSDNADGVADVIEHNPKYQKLVEDALDEYLERNHKDTHAINSKNLVVMLGMENIRRIICSTQYFKDIHGTIPLEENLDELTSKAQLAFSASEQFRKAPPKWAFAAGLMWDTMAELARNDERFTEKTLTWIDETFSRCLRAARITHSYFLDDDENEMIYSRFAFNIPLITGAGIVSLSFLDPEVFPERFMVLTGLGVSRAAMQILEESQFGYNHTQMAATISTLWPMYHDLFPAIVCVEHPNLVDPFMEESLFQASLISNLALNVAFYENRDHWFPKYLSDYTDPVKMVKAIEISGQRSI